MTHRKRNASRLAALLLGLACGAAGADGPAASWGAIASHERWYGWAVDHPSRQAAEREARARCDRAAGRAGACETRAAFDGSCAALATGNHTEWGLAGAASEAAAVRDALARCDSHLPSEPCKLAVSACSFRQRPASAQARVPR